MSFQSYVCLIYTNIQTETDCEFFRVRFESFEFLSICHNSADGLVNICPQLQSKAALHFFFTHRLPFLCFRLCQVNSCAPSNVFPHCAQTNLTDSACCTWCLSKCSCLGTTFHTDICTTLTHGVSSGDAPSATAVLRRHHSDGRGRWSWSASSAREASVEPNPCFGSQTWPLLVTEPEPGQEGPVAGCVQ